MTGKPMSSIAATRLLVGTRDMGLRGLEPDLVHRGLEELPLLSLADGLGLRPDQLDAMLRQDALLLEREREVERRLPAQRGEDSTGLLAGDDRLDDRGDQRLDIGPMRELRIGHDRRRVRVDQDDLVSLFE